MSDEVGVVMAQKRWIYATEPRNRFAWHDVPEEVWDVLNRLMLPNPPKYYNLPTEMVVGMHLHFEPLRGFQYKRWVVLCGENATNSSARTAVLQCADKKLINAGKSLYMHVRWFLPTDVCPMRERCRGIGGPRVRRHP